MGDEKYSAQARAVLAVSRSYLGLPGYRVQAYQAMLGVPVPDATQWDQIEHVGNCAYTVFMQMEQVAAQGTLIFHDDTAVRIFALMQENSDRLCQTGRHSAARVAHDDHRPPLCCTSSRPPGALRRLPMDITATLDHLGVTLQEYAGPDLMVRSPIDGAPMASLRCHTHAEVEACIAQAVEAFLVWRDVPAPQRGIFVRLFGEALRACKEPLARLVTLENGKILEEARGEVQEMIDMCDFAVGLSRQLYGLTIASERPEHRMQETWLPLGPIGVMTAFNFPVAVWAWNAALALVCGDPVVWKPSEKTPLTALACQALFARTCARYTQTTGQTLPDGLLQVLVGDATVGDWLVTDPRLPLISATGSCHMGRIVAPKVAARLGRSLLELGGNNGVIVSDKADLGVALPAILFGAVGTCGQRCTTIRRVIAHTHIYDEVLERLRTAYHHIATQAIGNPLEAGTLVGPLIDQAAFAAMQSALGAARHQGGTIFFGTRVLEATYPQAYYVTPALVQVPTQVEIARAETFAPILYVIPYTSLDEAITIHNAVPQGLSSAIFTTDLREAAHVLRRSDCGIVNVNIGTSGAEIGGAFGGEKDTGGGREAGADAWKAYMRRQTSTTYYGTAPPALAQGIRFVVEDIGGGPRP
jgi:aldehyde dehydrogenase (NAD+)